MRRFSLGFRLVPLLLLATCAGFVSPGFAADDAASGKLPIRKVVLFSSGVGFFEHSGEVEGDDQVELNFQVDDINDLLKSMVLQDLGGGHISTVSYGSRDPITKTLQTFAIDLTTNPTLADLLDQARGEEVTIDAPNPVTGTILGVETRKQKAGQDEVIEVDFLNLLTEEGLRSISLQNVGQIKFVDSRIDSELREALKILAMAHATDKKSVTLSFLGDGKRPVRVGYIQESPIWKTSYRLVLSDEQAPFLQGWSIVENTTDSDWKDVSLSLVSGRPISFVMDLYSPLYAPRPVVEPELYASLRPQTYDQDLAKNEAEFRNKRFGAEANQRRSRAAAAAPAADGVAAGGYLGRGAGKAAEKADRSLNLQKGVKSVAQAQDVGEVFRYAIATPVTLKRQRSAMLPIVNDSVEGEKLSIYDPNVHAKHPLSGLRLKNSSGLHLMQGPVTVFDDGVYAGDARLTDLPPGSERLISYAMDLDTEVASTSKASPEQLVSVRIVKGTLYASRKYTRTQSYVVKNSGRREKKVLVEYPLDTSWTLLAPKEPEEKTRDEYRFAVQAKPGEPATLKIEEERTANQTIGLTNLDDNSIRVYLSSKVVSDEVKAALQEVVKRKAALSQLVNQRNQLQKQIAVIGQEQERIRANMKSVPQTSDLFNRYLKKFTKQEDQIESLRESIAELEAEEVAARQALDKYLLGLNLS